MNSPSVSVSIIRASAPDCTATTAERVSLSHELDFLDCHRIVLIHYRHRAEFNQPVDGVDDVVFPVMVFNDVPVRKS